MWENRIRTTLQPNNSNDKKRLRLILALIASFFTAAAFGLFTWQRKKCRAGSRAETVDGDKTISSQAEGQESATVMPERSGEIRQETVQYVVRSDEERFDVQRIDKKSARKPKKRHGRRAFAAVAAVLAVVLICQNVLQYMGPASTAMAKESFGGIKQIVKEHGEDNPYVILDIVPGKATYNGYDLSLGTIGYLVNGQAPIQQDLKRILTGENNAAFYSFDSRMNLINNVMGNVTGSFLGISYEEGYAGTGQSLSASDGWMPIFDSWLDNGQLPAEYAKLPASGSYPTGQLDAKIEYSEKVDGEVHQGYDYNLVSGKFGLATTTMGTDGTYIADAEGNYHVIFGNPTDSVSGYRFNVVSTDWRSYSDTTGVYCWNGESFSYMGTVRGLKEAFGEYEGSGEGDIGDGGESGSGDNGGSDDNGTGSDEDNNNETGNDNGGGSGGSNDNGSVAGGEDGNNDGNGEQPGGNSTGNGNQSGGNSTGNGNQSGGNSNENGNQSGENSGSTEQTVGNSAPLRWYRCVETGSNTTLEDGGDSGSAGSGAKGNDDSASGSESSNEGGSEGGGTTGGGDDNNTGGGNEGEVGNNEGGNNEGGNEGEGGGNEGGNEGEGGGNEGGNEGEGGGNEGGNEGEGGDNEGGNEGEGGDNEGGNEGGGDDETGSEEGNKGSGSDNSDEEEQPISDDSTYYIMTFEYVENLPETEVLYQVVSADPIEAQEGESRPFDSYSLLGLAKGVMDTQQADTDLLAADDTKDGVEGSFIYVGEGQGEYKLTRVSSSVKTSDSNSEEITVTLDAENHYVKVLNAPVYMRCKGSNDWMKRYVFNSLRRQDNEYSDFTIEVRTVTAGEVTYDMVLDADLIYLEDGAVNSGSEVKTQYIGAGSADGSDSEDGSANASGGAVADISEQAIARIIYDAVMELKPVIVDYDIVTTDSFKDTNYWKLAKAFLKKDLTAFFDDVSRSDDFVGSILMNVNSSDHPDKTDNGYHYVNRNVYIVGGNEELVAEDFADEMPKSSAKAGFSEVLAAIQAENATLSDGDKLSEKVSKAMAVQYIINFSVGLIGDYRDLSILELQPTANEESDLHRDPSGDRGGIVLYWQREDQDGAGQQILRSSKEIETNITTKSVVAFNGEYQDINNRYDMIFIGLDGQNLYKERNKKGDFEPVYNDEDLNGKVYHSGDRVAGSDARYDANDITEQKKEVLLDYMRAGYPIVVENNCFKEKSAKDAREKDINTDYIGSDTKMYSFLKEAIAEYDDYIYTIEDVHSSAFFASQLNTIKPRINRQDELAFEKIETIKTETGDYRGTIDYQLSSDRTGDDKSYPGDVTKRLYLDLNYDGIFGQDEEVYEYLDDGGTVSVDFKAVCFGIVPWKLEVADAGNGYRRDAIQGYFTLQGESKATVRVLQVLDNTNIKAANLQLLYEEANNSMLEYYLSGAEGLLNMDFKIETVTPATLTDRLSKNGQYLSTWDVLVLGFGDSGHPGDAVASAVNDYIAAGGSVVVSSAGAKEDKGRLGIRTDYLGQADGRTYGALGAGSNEKYRYKDLKNTMFFAEPSLIVDKINEGSIAKWPYQIDTTVILGENTEVRAADYLLDIGAPYNDEQTHTTAWYTLNKLGERNAYNVSPGDAANNYYLYSRGSVVYVGQSEYPYLYNKDGDEAPETLKGATESMLFVNALMAAYNNGMHPAELSIVAGFSASATKIESIAVPFDQEIKDAVDSDTSILDETVDLYFKFTDNNLAPQKTRTATFYYGDEGVDVTDISQLTQFESQIWTVENNQLIEVTPDMLKPGQIYRIKAPVIALKQNDGAVNAKIYVAVQVDFNRSGQQHSTVGIDSVYLNRAQLFLLE